MQFSSKIAITGIINLADKRNVLNLAHSDHLDLVGLAGSSLDLLQDRSERCCYDAINGGYQGRHVREQNKESKRDEREQVRERADERVEREEKRRK